MLLELGYSSQERVTRALHEFGFNVVSQPRLRNNLGISEFFS